MRVRLVRRPGQHGTRTYVEQYGDRLICVRYRYDETARRRYKTIELIVDEAPWAPKVSAQTRQSAPNIREEAPEVIVEEKKRDSAQPMLTEHTMVGVRLKTSDTASYHQLLTLGVDWDNTLDVWRLRYSQAIALGLTHRIIGTIAELRAAKADKDRQRRLT